jgi:hypothetical protein
MFRRGLQEPPLLGCRGNPRAGAGQNRMTRTRLGKPAPDRKHLAMYRHSSEAVMPGPAGKWTRRVAQTRGALQRRNLPSFAVPIATGRWFGSYVPSRSPVWSPPRCAPLTAHVPDQWHGTGRVSVPCVLCS